MPASIRRQSIMSVKRFVVLSSLAAGLLCGTAAQATIVQFQTVLGDFEVNLFDQTTPITVENFLGYVNAGAYTNTIIHRSVPDFVVQGGGYSYNGTVPPAAITQGAKITNEPVYSNVRGTIAMAKLSAVDSATNQWFINTVDNSVASTTKNSLDKTNGGYTVFGQVMGNGMAVVDAIAALNRFNMGGAFESIPLRNYTADDAKANAPIGGDQFMLITNIVVLDANKDTAASLNPVKNTQINKKDDGGGSSSGLLLVCLGLLALTRKLVLSKR